MVKSLFARRSRCVGLMVIALCASVIVYKFTGQQLHVNISKVRMDSFLQKTVFGNHSEISSNAAQRLFLLEVNMSALIYKVRGRKECLGVAADPRSYWRSQNTTGPLNTTDSDIARMGLAFSCGMLYKEFFSKPLVPSLYPLEKFYLSEPPLVNIDSISNEKLSVITPYNSSLEFKVDEIVAFKIEMKNSRGHPKLKGGDQIRAWFEDASTKSKMAAKVVDLNNGTYVITAPLLWVGKLRLHVALAYPREYIRALLYTHQVLKAFRHIAAVFNNNKTSEATPCYHTQVVPGYDSSELCNLTDVNGSPWFCGHPIKSQLKCADYAGTVVILENGNYPVTEAEMEILNRSCREPRIRKIPNNFELHVLPGTSRDKLPCNKVLPQNTWAQEIPTGHMSHNTWYPRSCYITKPDYEKCFKNIQIVFHGDSNARSHYHNIRGSAKCPEIKKALTKKWHKPLLCVHKGNNFSVSWNPHTNPFMNGPDLAPLDTLIATSKAIDEIPSHGHYLIILNHYYHLTTSHLSAIDFLFRSIKDALVRLFQRNPNVQVVLQGPHIAWFGWPEHYAAGDMLGTAIMDLQQEIFHDIQDKVVFISPWDMTIATENWDYHPSTNGNIFHIIFGFMCGR